MEDNKFKLEKININGQLKNFTNSNKTINNLKIYFQSKDEDQEERKLYNPTLDIYDSIKTYLGIDLEKPYKDANGKLYIREITGNQSRIIEFSNNDDIGDYIEYLINLSIFYKLNNQKIQVSRGNNFKNEDIKIKRIDIEAYALAQEKYGVDWKDHIEEFQTIDENATICANNTLELQDEKGNKLPTLQEIKSKLKIKFENMSTNDIKNSGLSPFEVRKLISAQFNDVKISNDEINAIMEYKHGVFEKINELLIGNIKLKNEEEFFKKDFENLIKNIGLIYSVQKKFQTNKDLVILRADSVNENQENGIVYSNFVSTTITPQIFDRRMDGVDQRSYKFIGLPKGSFYLPMDLISEIRLENYSDSDRYDEPNEGEYLLPMCEMATIKETTYKNKPTKMMKVSRQINPAEILSKRLIEYREKIVEYLGTEKLTELEALIDKIKKLDIEQKGENISNNESSLKITPAAAAKNNGNYEETLQDVNKRIQTIVASVEEIAQQNSDTIISVEERYSDKFDYNNRDIKREHGHDVNTTGKSKTNKTLTLNQIGKGTTKEFSSNPEQASRAFEALESGIRTQEEIKDGQTQGEE